MFHEIWFFEQDRSSIKYSNPLGSNFTYIYWMWIDFYYRFTRVYFSSLASRFYNSLGHEILTNLHIYVSKLLYPYWTNQYYLREMVGGWWISSVFFKRNCKPNILVSDFTFSFYSDFYETHGKLIFITSNSILLKSVCTFLHFHGLNESMTWWCLRIFLWIWFCYLSSWRLHFPVPGDPVYFLI